MDSIETPAARGDAAPPFRRVLSFGALLMFGLAFVGLQAPFTVFGIGTERSQGHLALTYALCTVAMMFTAVSFGRLASAHPHAGSSYAYATLELHPVAGFFTGWVMVLDYVLIPIVALIIVGAQLATLLPVVPYAVWVAAGAAFVTLVNMRGVHVTARFTLAFNVVCVLVVAWFFVAAVHGLRSGLGAGRLLSPEPFYDPQSFGLGPIMSASAVCVLSFLGFDGIATLAEEARDPQRDLGRAIVFTCLVCGVDFVVLAYLGQLLWPDWTKFQNLDTAFREIGGLVGGRPLFLGIATIVVLQALTAAVASQASVSRLLYGMGRQGRVPARLFCRLHPRFGTPVFSTLAVGLAAATVPLFMSLDQATDFVNFGACLGFIGVNLAALARAAKSRQSAGLRALVSPFLGLVTCVWIWATLSRPAMVFGAAWVLLGAIWLAWITRGRLRLERP